ncbi:MAG: hypothetical protein AB7F28_03345 [Candidatus Margulisiibacteriota bacterium]
MKCIGVLVIMMCLLGSVTTISAVDFTDMIGVSSTAKGFAVTAEQNNIDASLKNPAALGIMRRIHFKTSYGSLFDSAYYTANLSIGIPINTNWSAALQVPTKRIQDIPLSVNQGGQGVAIGSFNDSETVANFTLSHRIGILTLGAAANYRSRELYTATAQGVGFDGGLMLATGPLTVGASIRNIGKTTLTWSTGTTETIQEQYNVGIAYQLMPMVKLLADTTLGTTTETNLGTVFSLNPSLRFLAGIHDVTSSKQLALGTELELDRLTVSFSYQTHDELGTSYKVGVSYAY